MPDFHVSPISIVNQIKSNLQDRYESGYPILKELLQNADDSGAGRFRIDALPGWPSAANPLLRGLGLLVVNDGEFREKDKRGITSFGESSKATDGATIGKFGFGQKAVFHLCDAFVVHSYRTEELYSTVVNPFLKLDLDGNVTSGWEDLGEADTALLHSEVSLDFTHHYLALWIPFRREGLRPAPDIGFSSTYPSGPETIKELIKPLELAMILTTLRHLRSIEVRDRRQTCCVIDMRDDTGRLLGPDTWQGRTRSFGGIVEIGPNSSTARFVGRETIAQDGRLAELQGMPHWPKTVTVLSSAPQPEKGEPHGAATLLRPTNEGGAELRISWAVFLPISESADISIPLGDSLLGPFRLLLHGYFFLDSGRRHIEGLREEAGEEPGDAAGLRRAWNAELRDSVVLPLVPAVLRDALDAQMVTSAELARLVASIAATSWFLGNRYAICRESALVRLFGPSNDVAWRLVSPKAKLRPLPKSTLQSATKLVELFPALHDVAAPRGIILCVDESASLTSEPMCWEADELDDLFADLSSRAFQDRKLAELLAEFLTTARLSDTDSEVVGEHIVQTLRAAMIDKPALAGNAAIADVLSHVPLGYLLPLPASVEHREVMRALAAASAHVLPVRAAWLSDTAHRPQLSHADLKALLEALEPHVEGDNADQVATAALTLLSSAEQPVSDLARDPAYAPMKVLRARDVCAGRVVPLSLKALFECSQAGVLFASSPEANRLVPLLPDALPGVSPFIVEGKTAEFIRESGGGAFVLQVASKTAVLALINAASCYGDEQARARLLDRLRPSEDDDRNALRRLCAGTQRANAATASLWVLDGAPDGIERIVTGILARSDTDCLIPLGIAAELTQKLRRHLGIKEIDTAGLEALLERDYQEISQLQPTASEREAFLQTDLSDAVLRRLPIYLRSDGTVGDAEGLFWEADWPVPASLRKHVCTVQLCHDERARQRQERLVATWSPKSQLEVVLSHATPYELRREILDALATFTTEWSELEPKLFDTLRTVRWLVADQKPVAPVEVLALPQAVDEAARSLLVGREQTGQFYPARMLAIDVREHPGYGELEARILPDQRFSVEALAVMIKDAALLGRLGPVDTFPVDDFTVLASAGVDIKLPGWSLMAAVLSSLRDERDDVRGILAAFSDLGPANADLAACHLDCLATLADEKGRKGEAARRAYLHGFDAVTKWPDDARREVFRATRVPNDAGGWRSGREVVEGGDGIAPSYLLARECASKLRRHRSHSGQVLELGGASGSPIAITRDQGEIKSVDLEKIEADSAAEQREFLQGWRGRVPSDLVIIYLGLLGRYPAMKQLASEWATDATTDVETLWSDLDRHLNPTLYPNPLLQEVDDRRFLSEKIDGERVRATAMSGDVFDAPLGGAADDIIVGNRHNSSKGIRAADGSVRSLITLPLRYIDLSILGQKEACAIFRRLIETVASDCLWLGMANQRAALEEILGKATKVDQATLDETRALLRDKLPTILAELKLPTESRSQKALQKYHEAEERHHRLSGPPAELEALKSELWRDISGADAAAELLSAVRTKIREFGYSASRVLFELFQNADDAYTQLDTSPGDACLRVNVLAENPGGFQVIHWGRPINHLGTNAVEGRRLGHGRDLLNMLLMNFSEKRPGEDLTGKFGLGFKSVHVLSDSVGIACGFLGLRTQGGFLPRDWHAGIDESEKYKRPDGGKATLIEVPFSEETAIAGEEAVTAFRQAMVWLPAFARRIRRIELGSESVECELSTLPGTDQIFVLTLRRGSDIQRALRFDLGEGFSLMLLTNGAGPTAAPRYLRRLWNLAPLEEDLRSGWLLGGPFAVDPGRGRLAGTIPDRQEILRRVGQAFGARLLKLHDVASSDWRRFAAALDLDASERITRPLFWSLLFDIVGPDFDDDLARHLHAERHGYGQLAAERAVVPTHLPEPFDDPVRASEVDHATAGALSDPAIFEKVSGWRALVELRSRLVAPEVAGQLAKIGFGRTRAVGLADLLRREIGSELRIAPGLAKKVGSVITSASVREEPIAQEFADILAVAKEALFLTQDGSWRIAQLPYAAAADDDEEMRLCAFAPPKCLLDSTYSGAAIEFFRVAREQSGFGAQARDLVKWAAEAADPDRQVAALRYVIEGRQGRQLAAAMRQDRPTWLPWPATRLREGSLLSDWSEKEKDDLLYALQGREAFEPPPLSPTLQPEPHVVLCTVHSWWIANGVGLRESYARRTYPTFLSPSDLRETGDRTAWFTLFALACFHSLGRTHEVQHRSFIDTAYREGWWVELAQSQPPNDVQSWLDRLQQWSAPALIDQRFLLWRRTLVDLYTVARWLEEYKEIALKLPRIIEEHGAISLNGALQPTFWPPAMRLCIDAAPINRSIGIGMNWMLREMLRQNVYDPHDEQIIAPYCWASSQRVVELLNNLGAGLEEKADKDASRAMYEFVVEHVGVNTARFAGDFDLPLQLITQEVHRSALDQCFSVAGRYPPSFTEEEEDSGNMLPFVMSDQ